VGKQGYHADQCRAVLHCVCWRHQNASYNLFNYVNEVNAEVEALEDSIDKVRAEIDTHMEQVRHWGPWARAAASHKVQAQ
jgi:hypothetical protein